MEIFTVGFYDRHRRSEGILDHALIKYCIFYIAKMSTADFSWVPCQKRARDTRANQWVTSRNNDIRRDYLAAFQGVKKPRKRRARDVAYLCTILEANTDELRKAGESSQTSEEHEPESGNCEPALPALEEAGDSPVAALEEGGASHVAALAVRRPSVESSEAQAGGGPCVSHAAALEVPDSVEAARLPARLASEGAPAGGGLCDSHAADLEVAGSVEATRLPAQLSPSEGAADEKSQSERDEGEQTKRVEKGETFTNCHDEDAFAVEEVSGTADVSRRAEDTDQERESASQSRIIAARLLTPQSISAPEGARHAGDGDERDEGAQSHGDEKETATDFLEEGLPPGDSETPALWGFRFLLGISLPEREKPAAIFRDGDGLVAEEYSETAGPKPRRTAETTGPISRRTEEAEGADKERERQTPSAAAAYDTPPANQPPVTSRACVIHEWPGVVHGQ